MSYTATSFLGAEGRSKDCRRVCWWRSTAGQHKNYEYKHAVRGTVAIDEYRLVDGSGYVDTGVSAQKAVVLVAEGEFDASLA